MGNATEETSVKIAARPLILPFSCLRSVVKYKNRSCFTILQGQAMGKLLLILFSPPTQLQNTVTVCELSKAAVKMGHKVTVFCDADATYNLLASQIFQDKTTAASRIADLIKRGVRVLACRESARLRGIDTKKDLIQGVVESSLGGLADLMGKHDRIAAFGSSDR